MAKKAIAKLQTSDSRGFTKVVKMIKSKSTGKYFFKQSIIRKEKVNDFFSSSES